MLSTNLPWSLANPRWASEINPFLSLPILQGNMVEGIKLISGIAKVINHGLQRQPLGWFLTDNNAAAIIHRTAWNTLTITLIASADATINIWVF